MQIKHRDIIGVPLYRWVQIYDEFRDSESSFNNCSPAFQAARFGLTGVDQDEVIAVQCNSAKIGTNGTKPYIRRDFDSVLGYTRRWPLRTDIHFYPLPPPKRTLKSLVHVKYPRFKVPSPTGGPDIEKALDPGRVPNFLFATFGLRGSIRIHFPRLYDSGLENNQVPRDKLMLLYDLAIRPAAKEVIPEAWARNFVWGVEIRGIKDACFHDLDADDFLIEEAFDSATQTINLRAGSCWYIDVGLEFLIEDRALLWSLDQHANVLMRCLGINELSAHRLIQSTKFTAHPSTQLHALSGFKANTYQCQGSHGCVYVQAYTTDKSQTYHPEGLHYGKAITPLQAINGIPPVFCRNLEETYDSARSNVDVATRLEMRVPIEKVAAVLIRPHDSIWQDMVSYPRQLWWAYRSIKLASATQMLIEINSQPRVIRASLPILTLVLGLVYIINSIHSAPQDDSNNRRIRDCVLPLTHDATMGDVLSDDMIGEEDPNSPIGMVYAPGGNILLHPILDPRDGMTFKYKTIIDDRAFFFAFQCLPQFARTKLWPATGLPGQGFDASHVPQRKGKTRARPQTDAMLPIPPSLQQFQDILVPREVTTEELVLDMTPLSLAPDSLTTAMTTILNQFASDIMQKMPNPKAGSASALGIRQYCDLTQSERASLVLEDLKITDDFTRLFNCARYCRPTDQEWLTVVKYLFPDQGHLSGTTVRHLQTCRYFISWKELIADIDTASAKRAVDEMRRLIMELPWLPASSCDRLWRTDKAAGRWTFIPPHLDKPGNPAPRIYLKPGTTYIPWIRNTEEERRRRLLEELGLQREEEEEESDAE
ncbi:hypothetical protein CVT24_001173 [Panaeolus cyanescens]|uniref:Uncharacterized protein n=1 Tax=Panaeolus cyanescens TaxID=181874 RepID=A0A409YZ26_9AGAR|nr:hypothetical protein CVT24_001173 [Panaeolus cyanescens]